MNLSISTPTKLINLTDNDITIAGVDVVPLMIFKDDILKMSSTVRGLRNGFIPFEEAGELAMAGNSLYSVEGTSLVVNPIIVDVNESTLDITFKSVMLISHLVKMINSFHAIICEYKDTGLDVFDGSQPYMQRRHPFNIGYKDMYRIVNGSAEVYRDFLLEDHLNNMEDAIALVRGRFVNNEQDNRMLHGF